MSGQILTGDALLTLRGLPDGIAHTCVTSPPYFGLRDYGVAGQIGLEETAGEYIDRLVEVFREVRRVLRPDGTLWLNVGDSYATRSGNQPPTNTGTETDTSRSVCQTAISTKTSWAFPGSWLSPSGRMAGISEMTSSGTRPTPAQSRERPGHTGHEYLFLLSASQTYYYDAKSIEEPCGAKGER